METQTEKLTVKAYLKPTCGWSGGVRAVFRKYNIEFEDINILSDPMAYSEMVRKSGQRMSPTVEVNGKVLADVSGEEVEAYLLSNHLVKTVETSDNTPLDRGCESH